MKRYHKLSNKQLFLFSCILTIMAGTILLLFTYKQDERTFHKLSARLFHDEMLASTLNMHYTLAYPEDYGIQEYDSVLPCYSAIGHLCSQASTENLLAALQKIDPAKLSDQDAYCHKLLSRSLENTLRLNQFAYYEEPLSPSSGMQSQLPILLAEYTFRDKQDVTDYLALLDQTDEYFTSLLRYEQEKAAAGLLMPASSLEKVINQCHRILPESELQQGQHFLQTTFSERICSLEETGELTSEESRQFTAQNHELLLTVMQPAYQTLADGLNALKAPTVTLSGLAAKPLGAEYYQYLLRAETGSYRSVPEIKTLLINTLKQEYETLRSLATQHPEVLSALKETNPVPFPYTTAEEMLQQLQLQMASDFPPIPGNEETSVSSPSVVVKAVSPSLENFCAPAFYLTAPLDDTLNNVIYINQKNSPSGVELYTTLAHEGYPGHLYQTVYSNRTFVNNGENPVRNLLWYGGYLEGWALYVEFHSFDYAAELMAEQNRPTEALCIKLQKHNRSLQLCLYSLLDIMIHHENTSYAQIAEVLEHFGITDTSSVKAIYTYIAEEPCNYLKYYLGYLEILELRKEAQTLWQEDYSDYDFHQFYLEAGPSDFTSLLECFTSETVRKK